MKKNQVSIANPDDLNKYLQQTSFVTWFVLGLAVAILLGFFTWCTIVKLTIKITGQADIQDGVATLHVNQDNLNKIKPDQLVYISNLEGKIISIDDEKQPVVSHFDLEDGQYPYYIVIGEKRPIDFLIGS